MNFLNLESEDDLEEIISVSFSDKKLSVAIFKHSSRCAISTMAKARLSTKWNFDEELPIYLLDLIVHRNLSNLIAQKFKVEHQSPQILLIKNGVCIFNASHLNISVREIKSVLIS